MSKGMTDREKVLRLGRDVMGWEEAGSDNANFVYTPEGDVIYLPEWRDLESHDAIAEVLAKLTAEQLADVGYLILEGCPTVPMMLLATPAQKADAILKALGLWDE